MHWAAVARRLNPYAEYAYDGLLLNPLEVLFVKVKGFQVQTDWVSAIMATTYDRWVTQVFYPAQLTQKLYVLTQVQGSAKYSDCCHWAGESRNGGDRSRSSSVLSFRQFNRYKGDMLCCRQGVRM